MAKKSGKDILMMIGMGPKKAMPDDDADAAEDKAYGDDDATSDVPDEALAATDELMQKIGLTVTDEDLPEVAKLLRQICYAK